MFKKPYTAGKDACRGPGLAAQVSTQESGVNIQAVTG
jgi:hypothetical protein